MLTTLLINFFPLSRIGADVKMIFFCSTFDFERSGSTVVGPGRIDEKKNEQQYPRKCKRTQFARESDYNSYCSSTCVFIKKGLVSDHFFFPRLQQNSSLDVCMYMLMFALSI
jgi:hypothetical protein